MEAKERILAAAESQFFGKRYGDVKLDAIARAAGIKKQSVYHHFRDKKALALAVAERSGKAYLSALEKAAETLPPEGLVAWWLEYPAREKSVFGVALQKDYCVDRDLFAAVARGKARALETLRRYGARRGLPPARAYLLIQLLERLAQANCQSASCLESPVPEIAREVAATFFRK